jgi:hypothetical protein
MSFFVEEAHMIKTVICKAVFIRHGCRGDENPKRRV